MVVAGIDIGSVSAKCAIFNSSSNNLLSSAIIPTGWDNKNAGISVLKAACEGANLNQDNIAYIVGTGYGRIALPFANKSVTEISCHAKGASWEFPTCRSIIDIGGQDSKVISLNPEKCVSDFVMNDKCAAGTGRFLQVLSTLLNMDFTDMDLAAKSGIPSKINSMCAVFAETEIVGLLAKGELPENIVSGVFRSIAIRVKSLAAKLSLQEDCVFTGGLANSKSFHNFLNQEFGLKILVPNQPQLTGAIGAAVIASELCKSSL